MEQCLANKTQLIGGRTPQSIAHFGEHLMIDGYGGAQEKLADQRLILQSLDELPARLGMRKLADPAIHWAEPNGIKDPGGWSGFVVIAESHVSIHTFPARRFASIDVYTCRNGLQTGLVEAYLREAFGFTDLETNFVVRGTKYPASDC